MNNRNYGPVAALVVILILLAEIFDFWSVLGRALAGSVILPTLVIILVSAAIATAFSVLHGLWLERRS